MYSYNLGSNSLVCCFHYFGLLAPPRKDVATNLMLASAIPVITARDTISFMKAIASERRSVRSRFTLHRQLAPQLFDASSESCESNDIKNVFMTVRWH